MQKIIVLPGLDFFLFLPISVDRKNVGPAEMPWGDYSDPYGVTLCPKFGSVEKHRAKIWVRGRKRLQVRTQTFASGDANVYKWGCKRLQVGMQTFALQGLSHQTHLMLLDELTQIDEGVAHASQ